MVKVIDACIYDVDLLKYVKEELDGCENCKDIIITDVAIDGDDTICFKAIVSDEIIDRNEDLRYRYK